MKFLIPAAATLLVLGASSFSSHETAELERIIDGDTLETDEDTVRFLGMDTPETFEFVENEPEEFGLPDDEASRKCLERYGEEATEFVENHTGNQVKLVYDRESDERGFYDRRLAYIHGEGDITRKLLAKGYARVYPSEFSRRNEFRLWERTAREQNRGLWGCD